jgi:diguanylate cyclase (GGDEF)-like protein/PAS domain S-box-containing protein
MIFFRKKAKIRAAACADIVAQSDDAIVTIDSYHDILFFNAAAERLFGRKAGDTLGKRFEMLLSDQGQVDDAGRLNDIFASADVHAAPLRASLRGPENAAFDADLRVVKTVVGKETYVSAVIRDASAAQKTEDELLRLAATDPLTGACNRREFMALSEREIGRAARYSHPVSVLMLDLDHFRRINDTYGHAAGDKVLQRFAMLCANGLRNVDVFGRWDGEEFAALLPETDIQGASVIAERLRRIVADNVLTVQDHKINFTVSIGVAECKPGDIGIDSAIGRADSALYDAKKAGRDRISVFRN